jgi:hypothetical protein
LARRRPAPRRARQKANAGFTPVIVDTEQIVELKRILEVRPQRFRVQFFAADHRSVWTTKVWAPNASAAVREAAELVWPAGAIGLRILDLDGREIVQRLTLAPQMIVATRLFL